MYFNYGAVFSSNMHIGVSAAKTVGGSSSVYTGVSFRPPKSVIEKWRALYGMDFLTDNYVEESLSEIEEDLNVHELPREWDNDNNKLFEKGAQEIGLNVKRLKINVKDCQQQGFCNFGCTTGAKQSTLEVQLPRVIKRGVELIANAEVITVSENKVNCIIRDAPEGTIPNKHKAGKHTFTSKIIVLAAGVLNTPALLLRSIKELPISRKNLGRYITLHPALNINAVYPEKIKNYKGFPKTMYCDDFSEKDRFYLETSFYHPGITAKNNPGYGIEHQEAMKSFSQMMSILILLHDDAIASNRIKIDSDGKPIIVYKLSQNLKESLVKAIQVSAKLFFAAGCEKALLPGSSKYPLTMKDSDAIEELITSKSLNFNRTPLSSAHPQGGARMGKDKSSSVCDERGKVYGTNSIYVCDASLFPTSVEVNPYISIMLLAKHVAEGIREQF
jgi:choline dehydrogenase-like flavoprotein